MVSEHEEKFRVDAHAGALRCRFFNRSHLLPSLALDLMDVGGGICVCIFAISTSVAHLHAGPTETERRATTMSSISIERTKSAKNVRKVKMFVGGGKSSFQAALEARNKVKPDTTTVTHR